MPPDTHIEMLSAEAEREPEPPKESLADLEALGTAAAELSRRLVWLPGPHSSSFFLDRHRALQRALKPVLDAFMGPLPKTPVGDDYRWIYDNLRLIHSNLRGTKEGFKLVQKLPHVRTPDGVVTPRVLALAGGYLAATRYEFSERSLNFYVQAFQQKSALKLHELWALVPALKLVLRRRLRRADRKS